MDLLSIARILAPLAPVAASIAGGVVAGPAGAVAAGKLTSLILGQFGLPPTATAGQLSEAVATAGEETARARINAAMEQARAEIAGFTAIEQAHTELLAKSVLGTQETMRAELGREHWFFTGWRPSAGWLYDIMIAVFGALLAWATVKTVAVAADPLKALTDAWPLYLAYLGALAVVNGILIPSRSIEKKAAMETGAPMPNAKPAPPAPTKSGPIVRDILAKGPKIIPVQAGDRT